MSEFSFIDFCDVLKKVAEKPGRESVVAGLAEQGRKYSLSDDPDMDSLDKVEIIMESEELLQKNPGFETFALTDNIVDKAKNVGDLYSLYCAEYGMREEFPPSDAAAA